MDGILVVDKPEGPTSHDVVARCRRALGVRRIGHAGTLDPMATGVLVLGVGRATRLLRFVEATEKEYLAGVRFGARTSTLDAHGELLEETDASGLTREAVEAVLSRFRGDIEQVPPMVSAIKVGGERLYRKARRGEQVERAPRRVLISELELLGFEPGARASAEVRVVCSRGTYVRALAADIGEAVGLGAHLDRLRRTRVGGLDAGEAVALDEVTPEALRPVEDAVRDYPRHPVDADTALAIAHGKPVPAAGIAGAYAVWGPAGLLAMAEDEGERLRSLCVVGEA